MDIGFMRAFVVVVGIVAVAGCAYERPQSTTTPGLDTGITSSSGGGMSNTGRLLVNPTAR